MYTWVQHIIERRKRKYILGDENCLQVTGTGVMKQDTKLMFSWF